MSGRKNQRRRRPEGTEWASLWGEFYPEVRAWFLERVPSEQDANDLAEESLLKLARTGRPEDLKAYTATTLANVLSDYHRRKARERALLEKLFEDVARNGQMSRSHAQDVSEQEESRRSHPTVEEMLRMLPHDKARLLRLRFLGRLRMAEVARRVGCSRDAAYKRVQRALKLLRERYAGREDRLDHEEKS